MYLAYFCHLLCMVAYFCHRLSEIYVDVSDLYVDLSDTYVDLSDTYVDLSEKKIITICRLFSCFNIMLMLLTAIFLTILKSTEFSDKSTEFSNKSI